MTTKRSSDEKDSLSSKKGKIIPYSTSEFLKSKLHIGDKSATVVGYIEEIFNEKKFTNKEKHTEFKIIKFILNNNDGIRIQCNVFDDNILIFMPQLHLNQKILLETVTVSKSKSYTKGNVNYMLNLLHYSTIAPLEDSIFQSQKPKKIIMKDIPIKKGFIKIQGFLRNVFVQKNKTNDNEFFGAITDGQYKLEVILLKQDEIEKIDIEKGTKLELIGDLQENGKTYVLKVNSFDHLKILSEPKMELEDLILGSEIFLIEDKNEEENNDEP